jgi:hypothetical protein
VIFLEPIVVFLLRFIREFVTEKHHPAIRAADNIPAITLGEQGALRARTKRTGTQRSLSQLRCGSQRALTFLGKVRVNSSINNWPCYWDWATRVMPVWLWTLAV